MVGLELDLGIETFQEVLAVSEWYSLTPQEWCRRAVERALDEVEDINPQLFEGDSSRWTR